MRIRKYQASDCELLMQLFYDTIHTVNAKDYTKEQRIAWTSQADKDIWNQAFLKQITLIAEIQQQIVGFGSIDDTGYLDMLYVHKDYQRCKIATALCDKLEHSIKSDRIITHASITAVPFFTQRGYHVLRKQQVIRNGISLGNTIMFKEMQNS